MAVFDVHGHFESVFLDDDLVGNFSEQDAFFQGESFLRAHGNVGTLVNSAGREDFFEGAADELFPLMHAEREELNDENVGVFVDDERGEIVGLRKHDAAAIFVSEAFAVFPGGGNAFFVERFAVLLVSADEQADEDFRGVVDIAFADESSVGGTDAGEGTVFVLSLYARNLVCVYPAVSGKQAFFFVFLR